MPQNVQTLIIGGEFDAVTPLSLFRKDARFKRSNIEIVLIKNAGHVPWIEELEEAKKLLYKFEKSIVVK